MRLKVVGCGDAFGSGGRFHTCFWLETAKANLMIDCGASSPVALNAMGLDFGRIDAVILSHLHGDHFGGLPFLLLEAQLVTRRSRPLTIAGPRGTKARIEACLENLFPGAVSNSWRFPFVYVEIAPGEPAEVIGHAVETVEVIHRSGAPSTAVRISDGGKVFAYSGDTEWTDALFPIARQADLFIIECYAYAGRIPGHLTWDLLKSKLPDFQARQVMITHMSPTMLAHRDEARAQGLLLAEDRAEIEF